MEANNLTPQPPRKILPAFLAVLIVLGLSASAYYFFSSSYKSSGSNPPRITINYPTYKGDIGVGVCQIPGMYEFTSDSVSTDTAAPASTLQVGIHIYHSDTDVTVQKILDKINKVNGNKILIAYYPSINNIDQKFSVYPQLAGQNSITTPATYTIPANEGFLIFSCKASIIHGIKTETEYGKDLPEILKTKNTGWVLAAAPEPESGKKFKDTLAKSNGKKKMKSTWPQKGTDFDFGDKEQFPDTVELQGSYKMVWIEFGNVTNSATKPAPITDLKAEIATDKKSIVLTWKKPDITETVSYIIIYYDGNDGTKIDEKTATATGFTLANVTSGKSYRFSVDTVYPDSTKSGAVSSDVIKIPAGAEIEPATNPKATLAADNKSITVTWTPPVRSELLKYSVATYVNGGKKSESNDITAATFTTTDIAAGNSYYFTIKVIYLDSSISEIATSNTIDVSAGTAIKGVTELKAELASDKTSINLTWNTPTDNKLVYVVNEYLDNGSQPGTFINGFSSESKALTGKFTSPSLDPGKSYHFTVIAEYLDGSKSDPVKSNTVAVPKPTVVQDQPATKKEKPAEIICDENDGGDCKAQYPDYTCTKKSFTSSEYTCKKKDPTAAKPPEIKITDVKIADGFATTNPHTKKVTMTYAINWNPTNDDQFAVNWGDGSDDDSEAVAGKNYSHNYTKGKLSNQFFITVKVVEKGKIKAIAVHTLKFPDNAFPNSPIKIAECNYDNTTNYSGSISFEPVTQVTSYTYKLKYAGNGFEETIPVHTDDDGSSYKANDYSPYASIQSNDVNVYNLGSASKSVKKMTLIPINAQGKEEPGPSWCSIPE